MDHVVMFSGGAGSWAAAKRVAEREGTAHLKLLFCDTKMEDEDLYRFVREASANVGGELVTLCEGRTPWDIFFDVRFLGNTRVDPCSRVLKRELADHWMDEHYKPDSVIRYVGIGWTEEHRYRRLQKRLPEWDVRAPMCDPPYLTNSDVQDWIRREGIEPPRLYAMGFQHNNCGGFCVKQGQAGFANLLRMLPERYAYHERKEQEFIQFIGKPVAILRDRRGGKVTPMTLREFRERVQSGGEYDCHEWGGCSCFAGPEDDEWSIDWDADGAA